MGKDSHERAARAGGQRGPQGYETRWYEPAEPDIKALRQEYDGTIERPGSVLLQAVEARWKVSLNTSKRTGGFIGSLTCNDPDSEFHKLVFITENAELDKLLYQMAYFYQTVLNSGRISASGDVGAPTW